MIRSLGHIHPVRVGYLCLAEDLHDALMMLVASSDNLLFSVRNLLSDRRGNLSYSKWGAVSLDVGVGAADVS